MFGDPRFKALSIRYARLSIGWDALESRSESRALATWLRDARADGVHPLISFEHSWIAGRHRRLPSAAQFAKPVPAAARALPVGDRLRGVERGQLLRAADLPLPRPGRRLLPPGARSPAPPATCFPPSCSTCRGWSPGSLRCAVRSATNRGFGACTTTSAPTASPPRRPRRCWSPRTHRSGSPRRAASSPATTTPPTTSPNLPPTRRR